LNKVNILLGNNGYIVRTSTLVSDWCRSFSASGMRCVILQWTQLNLSRNVWTST